MKKYSVYKEEVQLDYDYSYTTEEIEEAYERQSFRYPQLIKSCDSLEEAKEIFNNEIVYTRKQKGFCTTFLVTDICYIEEEEYDDDGEFLFGLNTWSFKAEPYMED